MAVQHFGKEHFEASGSPMFSVDLARKWRALAQRRKAHLVDLYHSGRWRLYYSEADFAERLRAAVCLVDRWTATVQAASAEAVGTAVVHGLSASDEWADIDLILLGPLEPLGEHAVRRAPARIDGAADMNVQSADERGNAGSVPAAGVDGVRIAEPQQRPGHRLVAERRNPRVRQSAWPYRPARSIDSRERLERTAAVRNAGDVPAPADRKIA
jgi:uncharacterized repeat protein (TIGR03809 family)